MKHVTYEIMTDDNPANPRDEFDNISTFYGANHRYNIGGKNDIDMYYRDALEDKISELKKEHAVIVEFSSNAGTCYAVIERSQLKKEYLDYGYSMRKALYHARKCAEGEIETWLAYCNGEVYGYQVNDTNGNHLDSCWGFYGYNDCKEQAELSAKWHDKNITNELRQISRTMNRRMKLAAGID